MTRVQIPERGSTVIDASTWFTLRDSPEFWFLVESKYLTASALSGGGARLNGTSFVGSAICADIRLDCIEKVDGALRSLLRISHDGLRISSIQGPVTDATAMIQYLVEAFLEQVQVYASQGRDWNYARKRETGSYIGGRLRVTDTAILRARGMRHLAAFDRPVIDRATPLNKVILAALRELETLAQLSLLGPDQLSKSRGLAALFSDCLDAEILFRPTAVFISQATALAKQATAAGPTGRLLALASSVLAHSGLEPRMPSIGQVPLAWFINLETLFEFAVRSRLARLLDAHFEVFKGGTPRYVFPNTARNRADPDLVISSASGIDAIGDVKYKVLTGEPHASDLYQLLVHTSAFQSQCSFLVYPGERFSARWIGSSVVGSETWVFEIDVLHLDDGVGQIANILGLEESSLPSVTAGLVIP